jgi:internalin A
MSTPEHPLAEADPVARQRIEENFAKQLESLDLGDLPLNRLPEALSRLAHLRVLALGRIALVTGDDGPRRELDTSRSLQSFTNLAPLSALTGLDLLDLCDCEGISDLTPLSELTSLTKLCIRGCCGISDLKPLSGLSRLTSIDLSQCKRITDLAPLSGLTSLRLLHLLGCRGISDLKPLSGLTRLTRLNLSICHGIKILAPLSGLTGLTSLGLDGCIGISDLKPLSGLTRLTSLDLSDCEGITDVAPLSGLIGLTSLHLNDCEDISDLAPLSELTGLIKLYLAGCKKAQLFEPIQKLLIHLEDLSLFECRFDDLPAHLYGEDMFENVADLVRQYYAAQNTQGRGEDAECKLLVVGNGETGKTSLVRLICGEQHRDDESSTHAIRLAPWQTNLRLEGSLAPVPVRVNIWDFGGQDLYHQTHRLFFQTGAVYLVIWDPWESERPRRDTGSWYVDNQRPLQYWVDQIVSMDPQARLLIVRNKADLDGDRGDPDWRAQLPRHHEAIADRRIQFIRLSVKDRSPTWSAARGELFSWIRAAVAVALGGPKKRGEGKGRLKVKAVLRQWQEAHDQGVRAERNCKATAVALPQAFVTRAEFDQLVRDQCAGSSDAEDTTSMLEWLHRTGVVFWNERFFGERILVDQRWAIQGIYTLLDRERTAHNLRLAAGIFTAENLADWAWDEAGYTDYEQRLFLVFMQSCGLCFRLMSEEESADGRAVYLAPQYLPEGDDEDIKQGRRGLRRGLDPQPAMDVAVSHPFLGESVAAAMINCVGARWSRSAIVWRWGIAFAPGTPEQRAVVEITWAPTPGEENGFGGGLRVLMWGMNAKTFSPCIIGAIYGLPGFPRDACFEPRGRGSALERRPANARSQCRSQSSDSRTAEELPSLDAVGPNDAVGRRLRYSAAGPAELPRAEALLQKAVLVELSKRSTSAEYQFISCQQDAAAAAERMSWVQPAARGDMVLIFLTESYLFSESCMADLVRTYQHRETGAFPREQARLWRLPSAAKHFRIEQPPGCIISETFREHWERQLAAYHRRMRSTDASSAVRNRAPNEGRPHRHEPHRQLFEFMAERVRWDAFLRALANHPFETSPLVQKTASKQELTAFAGQVAEELHRHMMSLQTVRDERSVGRAENPPEGLERMGQEAGKLLMPLTTFWYMGFALKKRNRSSLDERSLVRAMKGYGHPITDKTLRVRLERAVQFFSQYGQEYYPDKVLEFLDRAQGRPPEILKDGWDMWEQTRRYFRNMGYREPSE